MEIAVKGVSAKGQPRPNLVNWVRRMTFLPRIQAFEFCDQPWLKGILREAYMDGLSFLFGLCGIYQGMHRPFSRWASAAGIDRVLDLASGNGRPAATMLSNAREQGHAMPVVVLSDLHPDTDAFQRLKNEFPGKIDFIATTTDATVQLAHSAISICSAFHHFTPPQARQILQNATMQSDGIFIAEVFSSNWLAPLLSVPNLPLLMLSSFFAERFSWRKVALTTLFPIVPLMIVFDGTVSAFRTYRPEELLEMVPESKRSEWRWESGSTPYLRFFRSHYFFGYRA